MTGSAGAPHECQTCWFCAKRPGDHLAAVAGKMFRVGKRTQGGDSPRLTSGGFEFDKENQPRYRVQWEQITVRVPRCSRCARFHEWANVDDSSTELWVTGATVLIVAPLLSFFVDSQAVFLLLMVPAFAAGFGLAKLIQLRYPPLVKSKRSHAVFPGLKQKLVEGWEVGEAPEGVRPPSIDDLVNRLADIYRSHPEGFGEKWGAAGSPQEEVRDIGEMLNAQGGMELMLKAHAMFSSRCRVAGAARNLEHMWDG